MTDFHPQAPIPVADTFRDLCAELADAYEHELNKRGMGCDLINRARAALAEGSAASSGSPPLTPEAMP